ncbi:PLD nuclease N-terminal domain-containing protein [Paenibacillus sp. MER TA 81-3]|uniref:PLD nuclease N-terminal domain-containing protein n=1 Tax=Paenibacillus sp. MER TA 81-3 TaxID=2939573 RepID=UPI002040C590|nr:PLD nuclease N-terminal domain-containing protein [Paenibacillus sp. MER TA 81-3]MCM3339442.1 PLD nuclease N-terminal domain-containing protein [Paenibacillus sp. MER TA 81-3]
MQMAWADIPWNIIMPLIVVQLILMVVALVSLNKTEWTNGPKWLWLIIIIVLNIPGCIAYFLIGRKERR